MSKLSLLLLTTLTLVACGSKKKQSAGSAEAIAKLTEFKTTACGCKDDACIAGVTAAYMTWSEKFLGGKQGDDELSAEDARQLDALNKATKACVDKFEHDAAALGSAVEPAPAPHAGGHKGEAELQLNKLGKNAKVYYITNAAFVKGKAAVLPAGNCCAGPDKKCAVAKDAFEKDPVWNALDFQIDEPSSFTYEYESDGVTFTATAVGDPDCSGTMATYKLEGKAEAGNPSFAITGP